MEDADDSIPILQWNNEESWVAYIAGLREDIQSVASKYTVDHALAEDAVQNALIELLHVHPEEIRGFEEYMSGEISEDRWQEILKSFCLTVARNEILSTLSSHTTGSLYIGRSLVRKAVREDGSAERVRTRSPARYLSLDQLVEDAGLQISEFGDLSWGSLHEVGYGDEEP